MNKKVILYLSLIVILVISLFILAGCGEKKVENNSEVKNNNQSAQTNGNSNANSGTNNQNVNKQKYEYNYKDGVLTAIVDEDGNPKQTDFVIEGIILVGNRHSYSNLEAGSDGIMEKFVNEGYKKENINSSFYLNEYIEFYIETKYSGIESNVKILVTPHRTVEELEKLSYSQLEELANNNGGFVLDYKNPEIDNYKYVGNGYVNMDYPEGKYDILFTYKGKIAYFINITETKEEA